MRTPFTGASSPVTVCVLGRSTNWVWNGSLMKDLVRRTTLPASLPTTQPWYCSPAPFHQSLVWMGWSSLA